MSFCVWWHRCFYCYFYCYCYCYYSFLKYTFTDSQPVVLIVSVLASSRFLLELSETGSYQTWGSFCSFLIEVTPAASPTPLTITLSPIQKVSQNVGEQKVRNLRFLGGLYFFLMMVLEQILILHLILLLLKWARKIFLSSVRIVCIWFLW